MPTREMTKREKEYAMEIWKHGMLPNEKLVLEQDEVAVKQLALLPLARALSQAVTNQHSLNYRHPHPADKQTTNKQTETETDKQPAKLECVSKERGERQHCHEVVTSS